MSGGSFNYVSICEPEDLLSGGHDDDVEALAADLRSLGWADDAADATEAALAQLRAANARWREAPLAGLRDLWKALEWWRSGDWGEDRLRERLGEWRAGRDGTTPEGDLVQVVAQALLRASEEDSDYAREDDFERMARAAIAAVRAS